MGFENRDYYRDPDWTPPASGGGARGQNPACRWIIGLCIVVFLGQQVESLEVARWLALNSTEVAHGQIWRLITYAFCHGTPPQAGQSETHPLMHIVFNMIGVWWFGRPVEDRLGSREFLGFYLAAALFSGLAHLGLEAAFLHQASITVGASGAVMAILAIYAMWYPRQQVLLMAIIPMEIRWMIALLVALDTLPIWSALAGQQVHDGVAHGAHLGGLLFGFLYQIFELRLTHGFGLSGVNSWFKNRQRRQNMRLYTPGPENLDEDELKQKMDEALQKISEHGEASLTPQERKILSEASRRLRERTRS
jgi:membrane associated rhomboid family serine protease